MRPMYVGNVVITRQDKSLIFTFENDNKQASVRMSTWRAGNMLEQLKIVAPELFPESEDNPCSNSSSE